MKFFQHNRTSRVPLYVLTALKDKNGYCNSFEAILKRTCQTLNYYVEKEKQNSQYLDNQKSINQVHGSNKLKTKGAAALRYFPSTGLRNIYKMKYLKTSRKI